MGMESKLSSVGTRERSSSKEGKSSQEISKQCVIFFILTLHKNNRRGSSVKLEPSDKFNLFQSHCLEKLISHEKCTTGKNQHQVPCKVIIRKKEN